MKNAEIKMYNVVYILLFFVIVGSGYGFAQSIESEPETFFISDPAQWTDLAEQYEAEQRNQLSENILRSLLVETDGKINENLHQIDEYLVHVRSETISLLFLTGVISVSISLVIVFMTLFVIARKIKSSIEFSMESAKAMEVNVEHKLQNSFQVI